jgi:hypothetical protein
VQVITQRFGEGREQVDQVIKAAFLDRQRPIHISLGQEEPRPDEELPVQCRVVQPDCDAPPG